MRSTSGHSSRGCSRMRRASVRSASISRPRSSSSFFSVYGGWRGEAAGAEHELQRRLLRIGVERARGEFPVLRPDALAVEEHLVLVPAAGLEVAAADERVVVPAHAEGALLRPEDLDLAGGIGLHPKHRLRLADVPEQGSEHERGHVGTVPRRVGFASWSRSYRRWVARSTPRCPAGPATRCARSTSARWTWPRRTRSCARRCFASWT